MAGLQAKVELTVSFGLMMGAMSGRSSGKISNQLALIKNLENARKIQEEVMKDLKVGDKVLVTDEKYYCNGKTGVVEYLFRDSARVILEDDSIWMIEKDSLKKIDKIMSKEEFEKVLKQTKGLIEETDRKLNESKEEPKKIGIEITGDVYKVLEKLERLGYTWVNGNEKPTKWFPMSRYSKVNYISFNKDTKRIAWDSEKQDWDYIMEDKVFLNNYMIEKPKEEPKKEEVYLVWTPKGSNPRKRHPGIEEAEKEAERLAKLNPNKEFYVLKAVKKFMGCTTVESLEL